MDAFSLDTSGVVAHWHDNRLGVKVGPTYWSDLDAFTQGYVEALFAGWLASMEALPLAENLAWPDFEEHPDDWPWPTVFMDREGYRWDIVRLNGEPRRVETGTPLNKDEWGFSDLASEALAMILADCAVAGARYPSWGFRALQGRTFWAERQRRFDPTQSHHSEWLQTTFPPVTISLGDDGKVYLRASELSDQGRPVPPHGSGP